MLAAPIPDYDTDRLDELRATYCAYAPREERFDRITRTARRLLQVPIALISIVEQDEQWFRSVQGIELAYTPRDISFCGHAVALNRPLMVQDTWDDLRFHDNPLVTGPPHIRSYMGWPLEIAPGLAAGSLCAIDTMPRTFSQDEQDAMSDLARMAESELRLTAMSDLQGRLLIRLGSNQRKQSLDPLTGCWNIRGFRELVTMGVEQADANGTELALCSMHAHGIERLSQGPALPRSAAMIQNLAQVLRQRLPSGAAIARTGPGSFCALVPAASAEMLSFALSRLTFAHAILSIDGKHKIDVPLSVQVNLWSELGSKGSADLFWAQALRSADGSPQPAAPFVPEQHDAVQNG